MALKTTYNNNFTSSGFLLRFFICVPPFTITLYIHLETYKSVWFRHYLIKYIVENLLSLLPNCQRINCASQCYYLEKLAKFNFYVNIWFWNDLNLGESLCLFKLNSLTTAGVQLEEENKRSIELKGPKLWEGEYIEWLPQSKHRAARTSNCLSVCLFGKTTDVSRQTWTTNLI